MVSYVKENWKVMSGMYVFGVVSLNPTVWDLVIAGLNFMKAVSSLAGS